VEAPTRSPCPIPGTEKLWETGDLIGPGQVVAIATLPSGELVELGHHSPKGEQRCYLRLRDKDGLWAPADVVDVLPDTPCEAIDLKIDDPGRGVRPRPPAEQRRAALAAAEAPGVGPEREAHGARRQERGGGRPGAPRVGDGGRLRHRAERADRQVDAMAQIFRPNVSSDSWVVDYKPEDKPAHLFAERTRDCVFVGDTLALVGEATRLS
jgi:hypothetical protein